MRRLGKSWSVWSSRKLPLASKVVPSFRASKRSRLILLLSNPTMKRNTISAALLFCGLIILCFFRSGFCREDPVIRMKLGGVHNCKGSHNDAEIESLARFAVEEHNKKDNAFLEFTRLLRAKEQVVAGKVYYLTLEAMDAGKKKMFEAKVWVKPWMNFKQLQEFKHFSGN